MENISTTIANFAISQEDSIAISDQNITFSYSELNKRVDQGHAELKNIGFEAGDIVLAVGENSIGFCIFLLSAARMGITLVLENARRASPELAHIIKHSQPAGQFFFHDHSPDSVSHSNYFNASLKNSGVFGEYGFLKKTGSSQKIDEKDIFAIIYTTGTTGEPKGVMLSHHNISATIDAINQVAQVEEHDVVLGVVPIFHSLGFLATLWMPVLLNAKVVYHVNPLDAREIGRLAQKHGATILFGTPTFLRGYLKRVDKEQFSKLDLVVVGAEKLPLELAEQFRDKFGVLPSEGYGTTETSGPASVNIPDHRCEQTEQKGTKLGTVGRPLPGVVARALDLETRQPLGIDREGLIQIKGPNIMLGYWNQPEKTAAVLKNGWYDTGDMGLIDADGFIHITGRLSRFSKIGGEMVPHLKIEACLQEIVDDPNNSDAGIQIAVTAVPDEKKGERLVVLHRPMMKTVAHVIEELSRCDLPNLWIPAYDSFIEVAEIPLLGTGKLDLRGIKQLALEKAKR